MTKDNLIGLDRVKFSIKTFKINAEKNNIIELVRGDRVSILDVSTGEVINVSSFKCEINGIALSEKDNYRISLKLNEQNDNFTLDVNVAKLLYNTNERNVNNLKHLSEVNQIIERKLSEQGIYIDMSIAKISSIEINYNSANVKLIDTFKLLRKSMQKVDENNIRDNKLFVVENKNNIESLMLKKDYAKIKVYNKTKQLQDTKQLYDNDSLTRIEVSTTNNGAIRTLSKDMTLEGLINNWDNVEKWYKRIIENYIKKTMDKFINEVVDEMTEQLVRGYKTYDVLIEQATKGNLVDLELFCMAMKRYYKQVGKSNPYSIIKNTKKRLEKTNKNLYDSLNENIKTINMLFDEIGI